MNRLLKTFKDIKRSDKHIMEKKKSKMILM